MESKNETYVISLDAVDLNLLPISQKHRDDGAVPLWSKSNLDLRRNEYYEFVIKSDDTKEDYRMDSKNEAYVISLDALDLNLLPISQKHRDGGAVPLWSKSNWDSRRNEYYEFVIKSDDTKGDLQDEDAFVEVFDGSNINEFKVTERCYDAIVATGATSEYCMICNEMFVRENRLLHVDSTLHRQNLRQKSLDKNCVRQINSSHHHCVLCNDYFVAYDLHVNSEEHLTNFRNKIIYKCKKTVQDDDNCNKDKKYDNSTKCSDVLKSDASDKSSTGANKNTAPVNKEPKNSLEPSTSSSVAKNETVVNSNKTVKLDPKFYFCEVCQVKVPNTLNNIAEHNGGWSHVFKENKKIELREARINSSSNIRSKQFCDTCNEWISIHRFQRHRNRTKHLFNAISDYRYLLNFLDKENSFCVICQEIVLKVLKDITDNFTSSDHINKYKKLLRAQGIIKIDDEKYYCLECKVYVLHQNELLHIESKVHKDNLSFSEKEEINGAKSKLHYQMNKTKRLNIVTCIVCNVNLTYNDRNIFTHIEGESHRSNYNEFCARNLLVPRGKFLYCTACRVIPGLRNEFAHCNGRNHKLNLEEVVSV